jgi:hypothetical protein
MQFIVSGSGGRVVVVVEPPVPLLQLTTRMSRTIETKFFIFVLESCKNKV